MIEENHEKTPVRLVGTGIRTRDLSNASLVRYHGATLLGICIFCLFLFLKTTKFHLLVTLLWYVAIYLCLPMAVYDGCGSVAFVY